MYSRTRPRVHRTRTIRSRTENRRAKKYSFGQAVIGIAIEDRIAQCVRQLIGHVRYAKRYSNINYLGLDPACNHVGTLRRFVLKPSIRSPFSDSLFRFLMESYVMNRRDPPELQVKFWPPSITAKGSEAIRAIRRPLAFIIFTRPFVVVLIVALLRVHGDYVFPAAAWMRRLVGW